MRPMLFKCPSCDGNLSVSKLHCHACEITIEGDFDIPALLKLNRAQLDFVEVFLKNRGNIREVERELGVSYPTVRARLDEVIEAIGLNLALATAPERRDDASIRRTVLDQLSTGKLTPEEAMRALGGTQPISSKKKPEREEPGHG